MDQLKIDRCFIAAAEPGTNSDRLFGGMASLGRSLDRQVVAEGI
jgi:EAL domain-containing protein (putative c-di-GMP-specific phosphodiesterase class I)